ncbi:pheromone A receptor-domain-containing protein [Mycena leptocephala]|nr:pheromone A receptor-domain-containing protein [Mycena leptocephala]
MPFGTRKHTLRYARPRAHAVARWLSDEAKKLAALDDDEYGPRARARARVRSEGGGENARPSRPVSVFTSISMRMRKTHRQAHEGAAATSPPPSRTQSDIDIVGIPAVLHPISTSFSTSIPVDHLREPPVSNPIPIPNSSSFEMRLYQIASVRTVIKTRAEKRRAILIDLAIGRTIPLPLRHCYNIFEIIGCLSETYETPSPSSSSTSLPIIGAVSAVYCVRIKSFYHSRAQFCELLSASARANLNLNRYVCLMALASTALLLITPRIWVLWVNVRVIGLSPWISWADTHTQREWRRCDEAIKNSRGAFNSVAKRIGYTSTGSSGISSTVATSKSPLCSSHGSSRGTSATLPVFIRKDTTQRRDSFDSFADMSASYGGISPLEYDAEKALAFGEDDVRGMLPDYDESSCSSSPSSACSDSASSASSVHGEEEGKEEAEIEASSLHCTSRARPASVQDAADIV